MKRAIFCSLAFCAFQAVFADNSNQFGGPAKIIRHDETENKKTDVEEKLQQPFWDAVDAMKPKGKATEEIKSSMINCLVQAESNKGFSKIYDAATDKCDKCYDKADKTKNIKVANNCCDEAIAAYLKAAQVNIHKAVECVKKCDKLKANDCLKMLNKLSEMGPKV